MDHVTPFLEAYVGLVGHGGKEMREDGPVASRDDQQAHRRAMASIDRSSANAAPRAP
ncbi:hypothetical protein GJ744_008402 [Endocarpon pusillum]|uniref:Uncharacterized protein n=1 Tax=Endocarpon pusillum TaxID=364733 RepID=A0A8H7E4F5_9EURO|nr:hypothetical protein GJ744_008402 [Endocarpon pusillum]